MKNLQYKKAVNRVEGTFDTGEYFELSLLGKKLTLEVYEDGKAPYEIDLERILDHGLNKIKALQSQANGSYKGATL